MAYPEKRAERQGEGFDFANGFNFSGVPKSMRQRLKYADTYQDTTTGVSDTVYSLNSLFDPDTTGTGHNPLGFNQIANLYTRYRCVSTTVEAEFVQDSTADPTVVALIPSTSSTAITVIETALEQPGCVWGMTGVTSASRTKLIINDINIKNLFGFARPSIIDMSAVFTADPAQEAFLHVVTKDINGNAQQMNVAIVIEYDTIFNKPVKLVQSA